jgi:hypothetical protein
MRHQRSALGVAFITMTLYIVGSFRLQRRQQHPPRSGRYDLVQFKEPG